MRDIIVSGFIQDTTVKIKGKYYRDKNTDKIYKLLTSDHPNLLSRNISILTEVDFLEVDICNYAKSVILEEMSYMKSPTMDKVLDECIK